MNFLLFLFGLLGLGTAASGSSTQAASAPNGNRNDNSNDNDSGNGLSGPGQTPVDNSGNDDGSSQDPVGTDDGTDLAGGVPTGDDDTPTGDDDGMSMDGGDADDDGMDQGDTGDDGGTDDGMSMDDGDAGDDGMDHGDHDMGGDGSTDDGMSMDGGDAGDDGMDQGDTGDDGSTDDGMDHGDHDMGGDGASNGDDGSTDTNTGTNAGDDGDHDDHHDGGHFGAPTITPPGKDASAAEINAYLNALADQGDTHSHSNDAGIANEHMAALGLVERGDATHVAIDSGAWDDPSIWANGQVPGDDAKVLIPEGVAVHYDIVSEDRLFTLRVDGKLDFATDTDSQMIFDTMVVSPTGILEIGTVDDPVDPNVNIDLIVASNGPIDFRWDPELLSRGIIAHGKATIYGAEKDSHEKVVDDPMAGDTSVKFAGVPEGWQVGDTIVIAGTEYEGYSNGKNQPFVPPEDEVRIIASIDDDGTIHFDTPLVHDHDTPRADLKTSVANYTRNVSVETEGGAEAEVYERGHVMFMHSDDVDVRYAEFTHLGRTDKSVDTVNDATNALSNVQGRYSLHLHRSGTESLEDPAVLEGNAVYDSPGWGIVHHDSNALLTNNATYDTFGAGFVAETGNETGAWVDNIAIFAQGQYWGEPKDVSDFDANTFDVARGGDGFWFQGRMVSSIDNVAASVGNGFVYFHRNGDDRMLDFDASLFEYPDAFFYRDDVNPDDTPIMTFDGNEAFAANEGVHVVKGNVQQGHDVWSHLTDFTAWNVYTGANLGYTGHYIVEGFDLTGLGGEGVGINLGNNISELVVLEPKIDSFRVGMDLHKHTTISWGRPEMHDFVIIDPEFTNVGQNYTNYDPRLDTITTRDALPGHDLNLNLDKLVMEGHSNGVYVDITGTKTDSLGTVGFPNGFDFFRLYLNDAVNIMEQDGYWKTSDGQQYFLANIYATDRLTGEVYYETHPVYMSSGYRLDSPTAADGLYADVKYNGVQNITTSGGVTRAGDQVLDTPIKVALPEVDLSPLASSNHVATTMHAHVAETESATLAASAESPTMAVFDSWAGVSQDDMVAEETTSASAETADGDVAEIFAEPDAGEALDLFVQYPPVAEDGSVITAPVQEDAISPAQEEQPGFSQEDLWSVLTAGHGVMDETATVHDDEETDPLGEAA